MTDFYIGQVFWFVPKYNRMRGHSYPVTVSKIGRKWIYAGNIRFDRGMTVDGDYRTPGALYASEKAYREIVVQERLWSEFQRLVYSAKKPKKNDIESILRACSVLGIAVTKETEPEFKITLDWAPDKNDAAAQP